jgi:hypothetical protein
VPETPFHAQCHPKAARPTRSITDDS